MSRYLLILSCSATKRACPEPLPAIDRYIGVNYTTIHKLMREQQFPDNMDILILSAKYGLIQPKTLIEDYNQKISKQRACELQDEVGKELDLHLGTINYAEIFVNLSKDYMIAADKSVQMYRQRANIKHAKGGIGSKRGEMKKWILGIIGSKITC